MATTMQKIPVRTLPREEIIEEWQAEIRAFEIRYEMPSEKMVALVDRGDMAQTSEVIQWYHTYFALTSLPEMTPTTGIPGTTT